MDESRPALRLVPDRPVRNEQVRNERVRKTPVRNTPVRTDAEPAPLWRELSGRELRRLRTARGERLHDTAERAGISPQYLSEIERGRKDASSEMLAAVTGALGATLLDLAVAVAADLRAGATPSRARRWDSPTCLAA